MKIIDTDLIVLIDDNEITNFYNMDVIASMGLGCRVECFTDHVRGLEFLTHALRSDSPDRIVLFQDIRLNGYTGFELMEELEEADLADDPRLVVALLTSSTMIRDQEERSKYPCVKEFISKPLDPEKVQSVISHL